MDILISMEMYWSYGYFVWGLSIHGIVYRSVWVLYLGVYIYNYILEA